MVCGAYFMSDYERVYEYFHARRLNNTIPITSVEKSFRHPTSNLGFISFTLMLFHE